MGMNVFLGYLDTAQVKRGWTSRVPARVAVNIQARFSTPPTTATNIPSESIGALKWWLVPVGIPGNEFLKFLRWILQMLWGYAVRKRNFFYLPSSACILCCQALCEKDSADVRMQKTDVFVLLVCTQNCSSGLFKQDFILALGEIFYGCIIITSIHSSKVARKLTWIFFLQFTCNFLFCIWWCNLHAVKIPQDRILIGPWLILFL